MILTIILFLLVLSVLVLVHEWGHFIVAKKVGIKVEEFGIGFPPRIFAWKDKNGMEWSINAIPIGGFVKLFGQNGDEKDNPESFASKSKLKRFAVLFAGVFMNFILAIVFFTIALGVGVPKIVEGEISDNIIVDDVQIQIVEVIPGSPADKAGLKMGDVLVSMKGQEFDSGEDARVAMREMSQEGYLDLIIERSGIYQAILVETDYIESIGALGAGVGLYEVGIVRYPWYQAPIQGIIETVTYTIAILIAFYQMIAGIVVGSGVSSSVAGPIGIAIMTGDVARIGFTYFIQFAAILSINLAILNILPFPALDGGRIIFLAVEWIKGKPVNKTVEAVIHNLGFLVLMVLILLITFRDILNLF